MSHIDDDELSIIALGEPAAPADQEHLRSCAHCRSRLDQLHAVVVTARSTSDADRPQEVPASVWASVLADIHDESSDAAEVVSLEGVRRRRRSSGWLLAAAAGVGLLAGSAATAVLLTSSTNQGPAVVASVALDPVDASPYRGTAVVERDGDAAVLRVSIPELPPVDDGYYEVWMATPDASTMVALGTLNPGQEAVIDLPAGMSVTDFPLVDVSVEHFDGDPGHSATSVVRGQLPA